MRRWLLLACAAALVLAACNPTAPQQAATGLALSAAVSTTVSTALSAAQSSSALLPAQSGATLPSAIQVAAPEVPEEWVDGEQLGNPDAPVVVQVWSDFLCPACQTFAQTVQPQLINEYVTPGLVRLEYLYFPLQQHEPAATRSALAGACAAEQNRFWEYEQLLMGSLHERGASVLRDAHLDERLVDLAASLGLDVDALSRCLAEDKYAGKVAQSVEDATAAQVLFVPQVVVNGVMLQEHSFADVQEEIERQLP